MASDHDDGSPLSAFPLNEGALGGVAAFAIGYALTYLFVTIDSELDYHEEDSAFELIGIVFYNAHFVDGVFSGSIEGFIDGTERLNLLAEESTQFPEPFFYLLPVVLLVACGYLVASRALSPSASPREGAVAGAAVIVGYLPMAVLGTFLFELSGENTVFGVTFSGSAGPDQLMGIIFVGLLYPLVLGSLGGLLSRL